MGGKSCVDVLISADAHVGETEDLRARLPEALRRHVPLLVPTAKGDVDVEVGGKIVEFSPDGVADLSDRDKELEFRSDPSFGTDLGRRMRDMAREDVRAQVVFPNLTLDCGGGQSSSEYAVALATAYNAFVWDVFSAEPKRFKPAAMLPLDDLGQAVAEATRCIERGFATLFLPCVVPWQPYRLEVYEPLWSLAAEAGIPLSFHVFSGNLALGGEFGDASDMSDERLERTRKVGAARRLGEEQLETVVGMAAGMAPILELTGSGALERHPDLRFVVTEAECGWLPWALQAMDQMQERRHIYVPQAAAAGERVLPAPGRDHDHRRRGRAPKRRGDRQRLLCSGETTTPTTREPGRTAVPIIDSIRASLGPERAPTPSWPGMPRGSTDSISTTWRANPLETAVVSIRHAWIAPPDARNRRSSSLACEPKDDPAGPLAGAVRDARSGAVQRLALHRRRRGGLHRDPHLVRPAALDHDLVRRPRRPSSTSAPTTTTTSSTGRRTSLAIPRLGCCIDDRIYDVTVSARLRIEALERETRPAATPRSTTWPRSVRGRAAAPGATTS